MKIALIGNMNNNFFAFGRYLRDCGLDISLFITSNVPAHFQPQCATYEDVSKMNWIKRFPVDFSRFGLLFYQKGIQETLKKMDLIVAEGPAMAYLQRSGISVDVFLPYGSDLYFSPFFMEIFKHHIGTKKTIAFPLNLLNSYWQKKAICNARTTVVNLSHVLYRRAVKSLKIHALNGTIPMLHVEEDRIQLESTSELNRIKNSDFVVVNHSRQIWASNPDNLKDFSLYGGNKRNDRTFRAFANFLKRTQFRSPTLVVFEYGCDISHSKKLVHSLGIESNVIWLPKSERRFIMKILQYAHLGVDQLRENISGIGGTGFEIMASGVPLLTHTNGAIEDPNHPFFKAPIIDVLSEKEILGIFIDYETSPSKYKKIGFQSKKWFNENLGIHLARKYVRLFTVLYEEKTLNKRSPSALMQKIFLEK